METRDTPATVGLTIGIIGRINYQSERRMSVEETRSATADASPLIHGGTDPPGVGDPDRSTDILPCPFCGAPGEFWETDFAGTRVGCRNAICPVACHVSHWENDVEDMIKKWNRRARHAAAMTEREEAGQGEDTASDQG